MRRIVLVGATAMLFAYAVVAYHLRTQVLEGYSDFISFYTAARILRSGQGHRLYDLNVQYQIQHQAAPNVQIRAGALPFVRPPFEAWLFTPIAGLPYATAFAIWSCVTVLLVVLIAALLRSHVRGLEQVPLVLLVLVLFSYFPVFVTLLQGQDSVLLLLIFCLVFLELQRGKEKTGGMLLGLGLFKFPLVGVFLIPFVVARRYRLLLGFCITSLAILIASVATTGWRALWEYPGYLLSVNRVATGINDPRDMPNIRGLVEVAGRAVLSPLTLHIIVAIMSVALIAWLATKHRLFVPGDSRLFSLAFSLDVLVMLLAGYHAHIFDLVLLLPFLAISTGMCLSGTVLGPSRRKALSVATASLLFSPFYLVVSLTFRYTTVLTPLLCAAVIATSMTIRDMESCTEPTMQARPAP